MELRHPRPESERPTIDWDTPVGSAHAHNLLAILEAHDKGKQAPPEPVEAPTPHFKILWSRVFGMLALSMPLTVLTWHLLTVLSDR